MLDVAESPDKCFLFDSSFRGKKEREMGTHRRNSCDIGLGKDILDKPPKG